jgi:hypothetical protein
VMATLRRRKKALRADGKLSEPSPNSLCLGLSLFVLELTIAHALLFLCVWLSWSLHPIQCFISHTVRAGQILRVSCNELQNHRSNPHACGSTAINVISLLYLTAAHVPAAGQACLSKDPRNSNDSQREGNRGEDLPQSCSVFVSALTRRSSCVGTLCHMDKRYIKVPLHSEHKRSPTQELAKINIFDLSIDSVVFLDMCLSIHAI